VSVALIGFPTDINSSFLRGPAKAPSQIRAEIWSEAGNAYSETGINLGQGGLVVDVGDVSLAEDAGDRARIESAVEAQLDAGHNVLCLGGDHSITYPIFRAIRARYSGVPIVHFDAHPDLYPVFGDNRFSHACPFARILEEQPTTLLQIGIRSMTPEQREVADRYDVQIFSPSELEKARRALPHGAVYVTLDLDCLDPAFAPGVSHREPGGLSVRDVLDTIALIEGPIVGADIVELNPDRDVDGISAAVAAKLARELMARIG
jgi:agmatinase